MSTSLTNDPNKLNLSSVTPRGSLTSPKAEKKKKSSTKSSKASKQSKNSKSKKSTASREIPVVNPAPASDPEPIATSVDEAETASEKRKDEEAPKKHIVMRGGAKAKGKDALPTWVETLTEKNRLLRLLSILGFLIGILLGYGLKHYNSDEYWTKRKVMYFEFPGELFLRVLNCLKLPLLVFSMITVAGSSDFKTLYFIMIRQFTYSILTTITGSILGALIAFALTNTSHLKVETSSNASNVNISIIDDNEDIQMFLDDPVDYRCIIGWDLFMDYWRSTMPNNFIAASLEKFETVADVTFQGFRPSGLKTFKSCALYLSEPLQDRPILEKYNPRRVQINEPNLAGLLFFSLLAGICARLVGDTALSFLKFFSGFMEILLEISSWTVWMSPFGNCFLVAGAILGNTDLFLVGKQVLNLVSCIALALLIHTFFVLPILFYVLTRRLPFSFLVSMCPVAATAFSTASATSTIPMTLKWAETVSKHLSRIVRFAIPTAMTFNLSATSVYTSATLVFFHLNSTRKVDVAHFALIILVSVFVTFTYKRMKIGQKDNYLMLVMVILGVNPNLITKVLPVIWIIERLCAMADVMSDCVMAEVINHCYVKTLQGTKLKHKGHHHHKDNE